MKTIASCAECYYPIGISKPGEKIACPMCGIENETINNISLPSWFLAGVVGFVLGLMVKSQIRER